MKSKESRCNLRLYFTFIIVSCICTTALPQSSYDEIDAEVKSWYSQIINSSLASSKTPKTIDYSAHHYYVTGVISKGILCDGTIAKFYDTSSLIPKLLLEGKVSYDADRLVVKGIKHGNTTAETNNTYGSFYVYNMDDFSMNYKAKKAGALRIKCSKASYLEGFYLQCPVIVKLNDKKSMVYVDGETGGRGYSFLSAQIPDIILNDDDSFDLTQILQRAKDNVTMSWKDGVVFKGIVKPKMNEDKSILFNTLDGQYIGLKSGPKKKSVSRTNGDIIYTQEDDDNNSLLSKEVLCVKDDGTISEQDFWDLEKLYKHCYLAKWTFRNGNYFEGTIKYTINVDTIDNNNIKTTYNSYPISGTFKYPNGDRFEGDATKGIGPFYVDGTTFFADSTKLKGNWFEKYSLNSSQWADVYMCKNPSEARALATKLHQRNCFQEYYYPLFVGYFDPEREELSYCCSTSDYDESWPNISYDKTKKIYTYYNSHDPEWIRHRLTFAIEDNGRRKWEIVYGGNQPKYQNEYTWYVNGCIESIKSYDYNTKEIILVCHFFSDGTLRSAYKYDMGISGKTILRKSKESHPTFGGYTCKLYDLNGQYERSIDWSINPPLGTEWFNCETLRFKFNSLKPIE